MSLFEAGDHSADWSVLTDGLGHLTEGPGSNIFLIKNNVVFTPELGCLEGITRQTAIDLCEELDIPCETTLIHEDDLRRADEAFLTSSAGGIMPISQVDGIALGNRKGPGPISSKLHNLYWKKRWKGWDATPVLYASTTGTTT